MYEIINYKEIREELEQEIIEACFREEKYLKETGCDKYESVYKNPLDTLDK